MIQYVSNRKNIFTEVFIMTLVILAAGMGSRFGGIKQLTPLTENGEFVIDFTVFDAVRAGFDRIVFIIRKEHQEIFEETIGARIRNSGVRVEYVYQRFDLPQGFTFPEGRKKPWGTAQAIMCAGDVGDNFGVVNADDFYGFETFRILADFLKTAKDDEKAHYCSVAYKLKNTLSENGTVSRGICKAERGYLVSLDEKTKIAREGDIAVNTEDDGSKTVLPLDCTVSMNCFGFTPSFTGKLETQFEEFLRKNESDLSKCEFYLPSAVQTLIESGECDVRLYETPSKWMGVTYRDDSEAFSSFIKEQRALGNYPEKLWK